MEKTPPRIKLIRPGRYTATNGNSYDYSDADLEAAAAAYDPANNPAPMVVGHPKLDAPAFGWARSLAVEDGHLVADPDPDKLEPAFAEAVNAGRYPRISASFYAPDDASNPKPGVWYLKHIGFLGGAAPAVKGLGFVSLADGQDFVTLETNQENGMSDKGKESVDFAEREADFARRETAIAGKEAAIASRETAAAAAEKKSRHDGNVAFAEALISAGKLAPAGKDLLVIAMDGAEPDQAVSFGEAGQEITPLAAIKKLFEGAGKIVSFGELAPPSGEDGKAPDPQDIADRAVAFAEEQRKAGRTITIAAAVRHVTRKEA